MIASSSLIANTPYLPVIVVATKKFVWPYLYMKMNEFSIEMKKSLHCFWREGGGDRDPCMVGRRRWCS